MMISYAPRNRGTIMRCNSFGKPSSRATSLSNHTPGITRHQHLSAGQSVRRLGRTGSRRSVTGGLRIDALNREIDREQPWKLLRSDTASLHRLLATWIHQLSSISDHLAPLLPETARKISSLLTAGQLIQPPPLFQRLE